MASIPKMQIAVTYYQVVFFPFASVMICGDLKVVKVFGITVYQKSGAVRNLLGKMWRAGDE